MEKSDIKVKAPNPMPNGNGNGYGAGQIVSWAFSAIMLVGGVAAFVWSQVNPKVDIHDVESRLNDQINQVEIRTRSSDEVLRKDIAEVKRLMDLRLTISEHVEYRLRKDNDTEREDSQIRELLKTRVLRDEHVKDVMALSDRINGQRDALTKLQDSVGGGGVGKQLDNLQAQLAKQAEITASQITELRRALDMRVPSASAARVQP